MTKITWNDKGQRLVDGELGEENKQPTLYDLIREEFEKEIAKKTGWGRIEIMVAFDKAAAKALYRLAIIKGISLE